MQSDQVRITFNAAFSGEPISVVQVPPFTTVLRLKDELREHVLGYDSLLQLEVNGEIPDDIATVASFTRSLGDSVTMNVVVCKPDLIAMIGFSHRTTQAQSLESRVPTQAQSLESRVQARARGRAQAKAAPPVLWPSPHDPFVGRVNLLDADQARIIMTWDIDSPVSCVFSTRRGDIIYTSLASDASHHVNVISVASGVKRSLSIGTTVRVGAVVAISQDGSWVAGVTHGRVSIWSTETCECILDIDVNRAVNSAEFTSDGGKLLLKDDFWSHVLDIQQQCVDTLPPAPGVIALSLLSGGSFVALSGRLGLGHHAILNRDASRYLEVNATRYLDDTYRSIPAVSPVRDVWIAGCFDEARFDVWVLRGCTLRKLWGYVSNSRMCDFNISFSGTGEKIIVMEDQISTCTILDSDTGAILQQFEYCATMAVPVMRIGEVQTEDRNEDPTMLCVVEKCGELPHGPKDSGGMEQPPRVGSPRETSPEEALQHEQEDLMKAVLVSKADVRSYDKVRVMRLTKHAPSTMEHLASSGHLASARSRVESAGCQLLPEWANGALLLVPLTPEQLAEADDFCPRPHHIVLVDQDIDNVCEALRELPRTRKDCRPKLKPEQNPDGAPRSSASCDTNASLHEHGDVDDAEGRDGIQVDALDLGADVAIGLHSHDLEFGPDQLSRLRSLGLKLERTFLATISSQGSDVHSACAKSAPPGF